MEDRLGTIEPGKLASGRPGPRLLLVPEVEIKKIRSMTVVDGKIVHEVAGVRAGWSSSPTGSIPLKLRRPEWVARNSKQARLR
jgi:hypothetical protein